MPSKFNRLQVMNGLRREIFRLESLMKFGNLKDEELKDIREEREKLKRKLAELSG